MAEPARHRRHAEPTEDSLAAASGVSLADVQNRFPLWTILHTHREMTMRTVQVLPGYFAVHRGKLLEAPVAGPTLEHLQRRLAAREQHFAAAEHWATRTDLRPFLRRPRRRL